MIQKLLEMKSCDLMILRSLSRVIASQFKSAPRLWLRVPNVTFGSRFFVPHQLSLARGAIMPATAVKFPTMKDRLRPKMPKTSWSVFNRSLAALEPNEKLKIPLGSLEYIMPSSKLALSEDSSCDSELSSPRLVEEKKVYVKIPLNFLDLLHQKGPISSYDLWRLVKEAEPVVRILRGVFETAGVCAWQTDNMLVAGSWTSEINARRWISRLGIDQTAVGIQADLVDEMQWNQITRNYTENIDVEFFMDSVSPFAKRNEVIEP